MLDFFLLDFFLLLDLLTKWAEKTLSDSFALLYQYQLLGVSFSYKSTLLYLMYVLKLTSSLIKESRVRFFDKKKENYTTNYHSETDEMSAWRSVVTLAGDQNWLNLYFKTVHMTWTWNSQTKPVAVQCWYMAHGLTISSNLTTLPSLDNVAW